jgi:Tol biopolymer transport system component
MRPGKAFIFVLMTVVALSVPEIAQAAFPGTNGKIAFAKCARTSGLCDVWTMDADGTNQANITNTASDSESSPSWSADGKQIVYVKNGAIWVIDADGTLPREVVPAPTTSNNCYGRDTQLSPAWSPDSSKIVFVFFTCEEVDGHFYESRILYTVNADGTGKSLLYGAGIRPRWSPDGTKIGFEQFDQGACGDVYWVKPDGTGLFAVTHDAACFGDWSPDGFWLTAPSNDGEPYPPVPYMVHPDGTGKTDLPNVVPQRWSPDGRKLLWEGCSATTCGDIFTANLDGSDKTQLTNDAGSTVENSDPDWQPIPYPGYPRPRGATPIQIALVPASSECTSPNSTHGGALSSGSCTPPAQISSELTVGTPDANAQGAKLQSKILYGVGGGDVGIVATITDVRNKSDLSDYTGELTLSPGLRITDKNNAGPGPGTVSDTTLPVTIPCAATTDTTIGSTCSLSTTVNSVYPGAVVAGKRAIWQLGQVRVYDGGTDGLASTTADNTLFLDQGVFVP